jgi:hypothetical protein
MQNTKRKIALAAGAALIASSVVSGATFVSTADAGTVQHTLKFVATSDRDHRAGRFGFEGTEIERNHGRFVGYDLLSGKFNPRTGQVRIYIAVSRQGGLMFGRVHSLRGQDDHYTGVVTGGSGRFVGARGTITARNAPHNDDRTYVTIHYTLPS